MKSSGTKLPVKSKPKERRVHEKEKSDEFEEFIARSEVLTVPLSLIHTTDFCHFISIQKRNAILPSADKMFDQDTLNYLFYGRPSYRVNPTIKETRISSFAPICFIFKREFECEFKRIHPFDTGAFNAGRLSGFVHHTMAMSDYGLSPKIASAQRVVSTFYGSNKGYLDCQPNNAIEVQDLINERLFRVETYFQLIRYTPNEDSDERAHAIEVQTEKSIPLKGNLLAVVIPDRFFDVSQTQDIRNSWECMVVQYHLKAVFTPTDLMDLLMDKVREVLLCDGQIS